MKAILFAGVMVIMLSIARISSAQVLNIDVGVPLGGTWNPGGSIIEIFQLGREGQVTPVGAPPNSYSFTTTSPGDLVITDITNPGGENDRSNWLADIRFFNPPDPTGTLDLPATETEAFFPAGGFSTFQLMPNYSFAPGGYFAPSNAYNGTEIVFGPINGINAGQQAIMLFTSYPLSSAAGTPEPGGLALLFGLGVVGAGLVARRRRHAQTT